MNDLVFDFDGVIADTSAHAITAANQILNLIEPTARPFASRRDYRTRLNIASLRREFGATAAETLTDLHPFLVCRLSIESPAPLFTGVVDVVASTGVRPPIVTAGYELSVEANLGPHRATFGNVYGRENDDKDVLLREYCTPGGYLVTDTVTDVERCHFLGLRAIGVAWGYDSSEDLAAAGAVEVAEQPGDLLRTLKRAARSSEREPRCPERRLEDSASGSGPEEGS